MLSVQYPVPLAFSLLTLISCGEPITTESKEQIEISRVQPPQAYSTPIPPQQPNKSLTLSDILSWENWTFQGKQINDPLMTTSDYCMVWKFKHSFFDTDEHWGKFVLTRGERNDYVNEWLDAEHIHHCEDSDEVLSLFIENAIDPNNVTRNLITSSQRVNETLETVTTSNQQTPDNTAMQEPTEITIHWTHYTGQKVYNSVSTGGGGSGCKLQTNSITQTTDVITTSRDAIETFGGRFDCKLTEIDGEFYCNSTLAGPYAGCRTGGKCTYYYRFNGSLISGGSVENIYCP